MDDSSCCPTGLLDLIVRLHIGLPHTALYLWMPQRHLTEMKFVSAQTGRISPTSKHHSLHMMTKRLVVTLDLIIGSAEALPILCVSDFCERERERERERETPVTSFDITLKSRVIMHMITSTARRPNESTRSEPVECSCIRKGAWSLLVFERWSSRQWSSDL